MKPTKDQGLDRKKFFYYAHKRDQLITLTMNPCKCTSICDIHDRSKTWVSNQPKMKS